MGRDDETQALRAQIAAQQKTIDVLIEALEVKRDAPSDFAMFEQAVTLEQLVAVKSAELRHALDDLHRTQDQLVTARKLEAVGQLAAGVAHEINTPMQYIGNNVRFLEKAVNHIQVVLTALRTQDAPDVAATLDDKRLNRFLERIPRSISSTLQGIDSVQKILAAMKGFSHPGAGQVELANLNQLLDATVTVARGEWKHVATVAFDLDPDLPPVPCHAREISQCFLNIVVNAAHAIAEHPGEGDVGTITVSTRLEDQHAVVRISDTGGGVPPALVHRIFDPFFTTKAVGVGTGQGLAIVHNTVVTNHHGRLHLDNHPGEGATFVIALPVAPAPPEEP